MELNLFLATVNGTWALQLTFFIAFLIFYLWDARARIAWRDWFMQAPPGAAQVAVAILIADVGNWIVRSAAALWLEFGARWPFPSWLITSVSIGAMIGSIGILCKLRVFTVERFGHAPWLACAGVSTMFVVYKLT